MLTEPTDADWLELTGRAAFASHRLIGWTYWDPHAIENDAALGPDRFSSYVATRGASLGDAGNEAVAAAFSPIHPGVRGDESRQLPGRRAVCRDEHAEIRIAR